MNINIHLVICVICSIFHLMYFMLFIALLGVVCYSSGVCRVYALFICMGDGLWQETG